ncbi:MAG: hypothetical protein KF761_11095 [Salinibacterium sp.]|nr:hypothetical protein [Salinibacterium sp.]
MSTQSSNKRAGRLALLILLGALFSGCSAQSSTLAGLLDGSLAFKVCDAIAVDTIVVSKFSTADTSNPDLTEVWVASGTGQSLPAGSVVVLGQAPSGFTVDVPYTEGTIDFARDGVVISLLQVGGNNDVAQFNLTELKEGYWTDMAGATAQDWC